MSFWTLYFSWKNKEDTSTMYNLLPLYNSMVFNQKRKENWTKEKKNVKMNKQEINMFIKNVLDLSHTVS